VTNEQINAAVAEACGWTEIGSCDCGFKISGMPPYRSAHKKHIPDYCADLNEMHDAEKACRVNRNWIYLNELDLVCRVDAVYATARERAEALLRTLGKWEEAQP